MAEFKDINGRPWTIKLDAPLIYTIRSETCDKKDCSHKPNVCGGVNLAAFDGAGLRQLEEQPELLVNVLWMICREQAKADSVSETAFGQSLVGDPIEAATEALCKAIAFFFPSGKRKLMEAMVAKNNKIRELGMERALAKINDPELERQILESIDADMNAEVRKALMRLSSATSSPGSSASAQAGGPFEN